MQTVTFSHGKQKIIEFIAETLEFTRQADGLLVTASGEIAFQDTALVESLVNHQPECHVAIEKDGASALDHQFTVTFFSLEPDNIAVLLQ